MKRFLCNKTNFLALLLRTEYETDFMFGKIGFFCMKNAVDNIFFPRHKDRIKIKMWKSICSKFAEKLINVFLLNGKS